MQMDTIRNDGGAGGRERERGADDAGCAMVQRRHRVEQMGEHPRAGVDRGQRLIVGRVGVADRNDDAAGGQRADGVECAIEFGREGNQLEGLEAADALEGVTLRQEIQRWMYTAARGRDKGPFEMHPEDGRAGEIAAAAMGCAIGNGLRRHRLGDNRIDAFNRFEGRGDDGREPSGGAFVGEAMRELEQVVGGGGHDVDAAAAIDLEIDEAGQDEVVDRVLAFFEPHDAIVEGQLALIDGAAEFGARQDEPGQLADGDALAARGGFDQPESRRFSNWHGSVRPAVARSAANTAGRRCRPCRGTSRPRRP